MEQLGASILIDLVKAFGITGMVFIIWYFSDKTNQRTLQAYRDDMTKVQTDNHKEVTDAIASGREEMLKVLKQYQADMADQRRMYENNVELVRQVISLANDQKDLIIMNTRGFTQLIDDVRGNQFCPMVRLEKKAKGEQG